MINDKIFLINPKTSTYLYSDQNFVSPKKIQIAYVLNVIVVDKK